MILALRRMASCGQKNKKEGGQERKKGKKEECKERKEGGRREGRRKLIMQISHMHPSPGLPSDNIFQTTAQRHNQGFNQIPTVNLAQTADFPQFPRQHPASVLVHPAVSVSLCVSVCVLCVFVSGYMYVMLPCRII